MANAAFTPHSSLVWGSETAEGTRIASEVECERRHVAAGTSDLRTKPGDEPELEKIVSNRHSPKSSFYGVELPPNAVLLARSLDVPTVRLQAELLRVRYTTIRRLAMTCQSTMYNAS